MIRTSIQALRSQCGLISTTRHVNSASAVVLLSGGLDSATALAMAKAEGFQLHTLSFDYQQRHRHELKAAAQLAAVHGSIDHRVANVDVSIFQGSALTDMNIQVPKMRNSNEMSNDGIPITYVPARNTLFLSYGLAMAESVGASDIYIGANAIDYSGYPDCRPEYFNAFQKVAHIGTKVGVEGNNGGPRIRAPLLYWTKTEIIQKGLELGVDFGMTHSCYDPQDADGQPCGRCDSCILRAEAFTQLGFKMDPVMERFQKKTRKKK